LYSMYICSVQGRYSMVIPSGGWPRNQWTFYKHTHATHMGKKFENSPKLSNTFKCIRKWFYLTVLVLLHWISTIGLLSLGNIKFYGGPPPSEGVPPEGPMTWTSH
jgi:hypothetical protein